jgi:bisphosphoglycerate-independent phosphoglycerate mutase (AlkP superfamily)
LAEDRSFTLYEYFLTDKAGHDQDSKTAVRLLNALAAFVLELLRHVDLRKTTVILTSDHGNVENLSTRNHTLNDVPTLVWGAHASETARRIKSLVDLAPTILDLVFNSPD